MGERMTRTPDGDPIARAPEPPHGASEEFLRRVFDPIWRRHRLTPSSKTLLAVGCGASDLSQSLAARFGLVLELRTAGAGRAPQAPPNLVVSEGGPGTLSKVPDDAIDVCLACDPVGESGAVRDHREVLAHFARVLRPGGLAHLRVPPTTDGFFSALARWVNRRRGPDRRLDRALSRVGLVPVESLRTADGTVWVLARKPWK